MLITFGFPVGFFDRALVVTQVTRSGHSFLIGTSAVWESEEQAARLPRLGPGDVWSPPPALDGSPSPPDGWRPLR